MARVTVICRFCGTTRSFGQAAAVRRHTCGGEDCVSHARRISGGASKNVGAANPRYRHGRLARAEKRCRVCGAPFVGPAQRKYCSLRCAGKARTLRAAGIGPD